MKLVKFRTEFSNDFGDFKTNAGSGTCELQYEAVNGVPIVKTDKNGVVITYNRWSDIQKNKDTNNYKKLLEAGCDIKLFQADVASYVDTTQFGDSGAELLSAKAKLNEKNVNVEDLKKLIEQMFANQIKLQQQKMDESKKMEESKKQEKKEVKDNVDKKQN